MTAPKVKIEKTPLYESRFRDGDRTWDAATLIEYCNEKGYESFDVPLAAIDLSGMPWKINSLSDFIDNMYRSLTTDLQHPIILDDEGSIADGYHRLVKAIINGETYIKAIRIEEMPRPSGIKNN